MSTVRRRAQSGHAPKQRWLPSAMSGSPQRRSVHLSPFKPRQPRRPKEKPEAWSSQLLRSTVEHKKERLEPLLFGFIRKDATAHRRPYTFRTPGRSTPNAGRNGQQRPRLVRTSRCLLEHRRTRRRLSDRHHGRREVPRRRPGWQLLTRVTGPQPLQFQVSTLRFSIRVYRREA
jgi:hypothetical protein